MKVYLRKITGIEDALVSMLMSRRSWSAEKEQKLRHLVNVNTTMTTGFDGFIVTEDYVHQMNLLEKYAIEYHETTLLRFIDLTFVVEGLHRAAQDDFDAHAKRLDNRIIRASTRMGSFKEGEKSEYYKDKIMYPLEAFKAAGITIPEKVFDADGDEYILRDFGYVRKDLADIQDVKRGLYPLAIPSNFICKVQYPELCHIVQFRDKSGHAHPELQKMIEDLKKQVMEANPMLGRNLNKLQMEPGETK